jgi:cytochrome c oxidase assembly protein subunit 16
VGHPRSWCEEEPTSGAAQVEVRKFPLVEVLTRPRESKVVSNLTLGTSISLMPTFSSRKFVGSANENTLGVLYRRHLARHPFLLFGLPFIATIVAGSFFLTPATALRFEKHDRKVKTLSQDEALGLSKDRRKLDINEEYYVRMPALLVKGEREI